MVLRLVAARRSASWTVAVFVRWSMVQYAPVPATRYDTLIAELRASLPAREAPAAFDTYLDKVRRHAYEITDEDVEALKAAGHSEDEIFEHTVTAAAEAGLERLEAGLRTLS